MRVKPVVPRELANRDVEEALAFYATEGSADTALRFIEALEQAFARIGGAASTGSPRYSHELNLPGLRFWPLKHFPHLVFYLERSDHIDVWRVLHGERDIPQWVRGGAAE